MTNLTIESSNHDNNPRMDALQESMVQSVQYFSILRLFQVEDDFIKEKIDQISEQHVAFRTFSEHSIEHSFAMSALADDLIVFADNCQDTTLSNDDLLVYLRDLLDEARINKVKSESLKDQLGTIKKFLNDIHNRIFHHNEQIERKEQEEKEEISQQKSKSDAATKVFGVATLGTIVIAIGVFLSGNPSIGLLRIAMMIAATSTSFTGGVTVVSSITSIVLDYKLKSNRNMIPTLLKTLLDGLQSVMDLLSGLDSYWDQQIAAIQCIIHRLETNDRDGRRISKLEAKSIASKSKVILEEAKNFTVNMRAVLNRDAMMMNRSLGDA